MPTIRLLKTRTKATPYRHTNQSSKYYDTKQWKMLRKAYWKAHPLCECCLKKGIVRQADEVHHKHIFLRGKSEEERWNLLLDWNNLMSVCSECHAKLHAYANKHNLDIIDHYD